jgi:arachidonate 15-lipoxygenase
MTAFLPQYDPYQDYRQRTLQARRLEYQYNHTYVSPLALLDHIPSRDRFSFSWMATMGERVLTALRNRLEAEMSLQAKAVVQTRHTWFSEMIDIGFIDFTAFFHSITETVDVAISAPARTLSEYSELFRTIGLPAVARDYDKDEVFAEMRVAGPNPLMIRRIDRLDDFPVGEKDYQSVLPGDSLEAAGKEGRLYLADYSSLDGIESGTYGDGKKYPYAPRALFAVHRATKKLTPIAIQCNPKPGPDNPVFTPADGWNWMLAKTVVEMADGNYHEAISHFARTHLLVEPFVISAHRQLAENHPLMILLLPHFEGTLAINDAAHRHLIADGGAVDKLMAGTIGASRGLVVRGLQEHRFRDALLPQTFKARGVDDVAALPYYPYRDDALLYWSAIRDWVAAYVAVYYPSDDDVRDDPELAAWITEVGSAEGGRLQGVDRNDALTREGLIDIVTLIIYTCSVQHAAVNFPQYDLMSYVPNMPLACYAPAPKNKSGATEADYLAMLPPLAQAELQLTVGYALGSVHYTTLGQYTRGLFRHKAVQEALTKLEFRLKEIGATIVERNLARRTYDFLLPASIPQSINV